MPCRSVKPKRQPALVILWMGGVEMRCQDKSQNAVTKKLQPLIGSAVNFRAGMCECLDQQGAVRKTVADNGLKPGQFLVLRARAGQVIPSPMRP